MQLFLERGTNSSFLIELIISYLKLQERKKINIIHLSTGALKSIQLGHLKIKAPSLILSNGQIIQQKEEICKKLFDILPHIRNFFLGENEQQSLMIINAKNNIEEGKNMKKNLNKYLQPRTFFVSNHLTFADFTIFVQIYDMMIEMTDDQKNQFCNIFRWYKHIQNLPEIKAFLIKQERFLISDPNIQIPFIVEKKQKPKKEKKQAVENKQTESKAQKKQQESKGENKVQEQASKWTDTNKSAEEKV